MSTGTAATSLGSELPEKWPRTLVEAQRVIDAIRFRLQSELQVDTPELRELARQFALLCRRCNDRLREAETILKQGNLAQVIQTCDVQPRLFDLVSIADIPERAEWMQLVLLYDLDEPEPILIEIGEQLNNAYSQGASLETLLSRHRLLALARAPLMERAKVLRALRAADPASFHWTDDLRELEAAWLRDLETEIQSAYARRDSGFLRETLSHLQSGELLEKPPERILKMAKARLDALAQANARKMLASIADKLDEAFNALDRGRAQPLRTQWMQHTVVAKLASDDPLVLRVSPVLAWLMDQDVQAAADADFERAIEAVRRTADSPTAAVDELNSAMSRLSGQGREIPADLATVFQTAVSKAYARQRLRRNAIVAAVAASLVVVGGAAYFTYSALQKARALTALVAQIQSLLDRDELTAAGDLMPGLLAYSASPERSQVEKRFAEMMSQEKSRLDKYETALREAGLPTMSPEQALETLQRAASIARAGPEKDRVAALDKGLREQLAADRLAADTEVRRLCESLEARLKAWGEPRPVAVELDRIRSELDAAEPEFSRLRTMSERASAELKNLAGATESRRKVLRNAIDKSTRRMTYLAEMDAQSLIDPAKAGVNPKSMLTAWFDAWKRYAAAFPDDPLSRTQGLDEEPALWAAALEASKLVDADEDWIPAEPRLIDLRVKALSDRLEAFKDIPEGEALREYHDLLESVHRQYLGPDGNQSSGAREKFRQLLADPLNRDTYVVVVDRQSYYVPSREAIVGFLGSRKLTYLVGNNIAQTKNTVISKDDVSDADLRSWKPIRSPQAVFAAEFLPAFEAKNNREWLDLTESMAKALITQPRWDVAVGRTEAASDKTPIVMDPMQRFLLLRSILQFSGEGHAILRDELRSRLSVLDDPDLNLDALWMDPKNPGGAAARSRAESRLNQSRPILEAWPAARQRQTALQLMIRGKLRAVGWLHRGEGRDWALRSNWKPESGWILEVLLPSTDTVASRWVAIGPVGAKGELPGLASHVESFREGRLVFARTRGNSVKATGK